TTHAGSGGWFRRSKVTPESLLAGNLPLSSHIHRLAGFLPPPRKEDRMSGFNKGLLASALLGAGLQVVVLSGIDHRLDARGSSNVLGIGLSLLAPASVIGAARTPDAYARRFWRFTAASLGVFTMGNVLSTYYDSVLHANVHAVWPSDILFFLFPA